jgi:hypothetical protein
MGHETAYLAAVAASDELIQPFNKIQRDLPAPELAHVAWSFKMKLDKCAALTAEYAALLESVPVEVAFAEAAWAARAKLDMRNAMIRAHGNINKVVTDLLGARPARRV